MLVALGLRVGVLVLVAAGTTTGVKGVLVLVIVGVPLFVIVGVAVGVTLKVGLKV